MCLSARSYRRVAVTSFDLGTCLSVCSRRQCQQSRLHQVYRKRIRIHFVIVLNHKHFTNRWILYHLFPDIPIWSHNLPFRIADKRIQNMLLTFDSYVAIYESALESTFVIETIMSRVDSWGRTIICLNISLCEILSVFCRSDMRLN